MLRNVLIVAPRKLLRNSQWIRGGDCGVVGVGNRIGVGGSSGGSSVGSVGSIGVGRGLKSSKGKSNESMEMPTKATSQLADILKKYEDNPETQAKVERAYLEGYTSRLMQGYQEATKKPAGRRFLEWFLGCLFFIWFLDFAFEVAKEVKRIKDDQGGKDGAAGSNSADNTTKPKTDDSAGPIKHLSMKVDLDIKKANPEDIKVRFADVRGVDEAKEELQFIVDFLRDPERFSRLGGTLPKGVLLIGNPGVGKTLLARAVAGEAGVPFFHASGSEFDEVYVGMGARRMRQLFAAAKANQPCVLFIDEIDSCGAKRISSQMHPFANHTVNQMLTEMDGFTKNSGVIVLGATNRKENLDEALLRPGRFDVEVQVNLPDAKGREEILQFYLEKVKVEPEVDVSNVAKSTPGFSGADLENLVNQAAVHAAKEKHVGITKADIEWAKDKIIMGPEKKGKIMDKETLRNTAYHEAGHTVVAYFTQHSFPIHKVTIIPRGQSLGHTSFIPSSETDLTKKQLEAQLDVAMGGRIGEHILDGEKGVPKGVTTGASADFSSATNLAISMVTRYGMSPPVGMRVFDPDMKDVSNVTKKLVDGEIKRLLDESFARANKLLSLHASAHRSLAEALISRETLSLKEIEDILGPRGEAGDEAKTKARKEETKPQATVTAATAATAPATAATAATTSAAVAAITTKLMGVEEKVEDVDDIFQDDNDNPFNNDSGAEKDEDGDAAPLTGSWSKAEDNDIAASAMRQWSDDSSDGDVRAPLTRGWSDIFKVSLDRNPVIDEACSDVGTGACRNDAKFDSGLISDATPVTGHWNDAINAGLNRNAGSPLTPRWSDDIFKEDAAPSMGNWSSAVDAGSECDAGATPTRRWIVDGDKSEVDKFWSFSTERVEIEASVGRSELEKNLGDADGDRLEGSAMENRRIEDQDLNPTYLGSNSALEAKGSKDTSLKTECAEETISENSEKIEDEKSVEEPTKIRWMFEEDPGEGREFETDASRLLKVDVDDCVEAGASGDARDFGLEIKAGDGGEGPEMDRPTDLTDGKISLTNGPESSTDGPTGLTDRPTSLTNAGDSQNSKGTLAEESGRRSTCDCGKDDCEWTSTKRVKSNKRTSWFNFFK